MTSDLIFVLAGRPERKIAALRLFREGRGRSLLISVARFEIRPSAPLAVSLPVDLLDIARPIPPRNRHLFVLMEGPRTEVYHVRPGRFGTLTEVQALAAFLENRTGVVSIAVISSRDHLRRVRLCCKRLLSRGVHVEFISIPNATAGWFSRAQQRSTELAKLLVYLALFSCGITHKREPVLLARR